MVTIIVHHEGAGLLRICLESLLASREVEPEVWILWNAGEEPLPAIATESAAVHVVRSENPLGFSQANNEALCQARKLGPIDHVFFLNNDTEVAPDTLKTLTAHLESDPTLGIVGPCVRIWGAKDHLNSLGLNLTRDGEAWDEGIGVAVQDYEPLPEAPTEVAAVTGCALLVRESVLLEMGDWDEIYGFYFEDLDLCLRAWSHGWRVALIPDAEMFHAISATAGVVSDFKRLLSWRNRFVLLAIHWPPSLLLTVLPRLLAREAAIFTRRISLKAHDDARLQARSWASALWLLPRAIIRRFRRGRRKSWTRFLHPSGSVPVIRLPEYP